MGVLRSDVTSEEIKHTQKMATECEATVETASSSLQAPESTQALVADDSSVKTIEFLRARLLSERVASKAARQQAQEIAEKVKDLNAQLDTEIANRKKAEAAMEKVFTVLKARGLAVDDGLAISSTGFKDQPEREEVSTLDDIKEMDKVPSSIMDPSIDKEVSLKPLEDKDEGTVEQKKHSGGEPHVIDSEKNGIILKEDQPVGACCSNQDASPYSVCNIDVVQADAGENILLPNAAEHHECLAQLAVTDKPVVYTNNNSTLDLKDLHTSQNLDQGLAIMLKLKAMLHQIEEEVSALPKEQPLKHELQGWMDHIAGVLDDKKEAHSEMHASDGRSKAGTDFPLKEATAIKAKGLAHTQRPILLTHDIPKGKDTTEEMGKSLSLVHKEMLQQANMLPALPDYSREFSSTMHPPTGKDPALPTKMFHSRRSSYESLHFLQEPPKMPIHPPLMQYGISQASVVHSPMSANGYTSSHITEAEAPYLVEAPSPRSSDVFSVGDGGGYGYEQWCAGSGSERQAGCREDALKHQCDTWSKAGRSREMLSRPYIEDVSNVLHMKQDEYLVPQNMHAYPYRTYMHYPVRNAADMSMKCNIRHPNSLPCSDTTLLLADDRKGRLGDILMALDAARQHVTDERQSIYAEEQLFRPPTSTEEDPRLNYTWRPRTCSQTPIIQFPPSPASEHAYSSFDRHSRYRKNSSTASNFMISAWENYLQPRGEVKLGNGITLYTD